MQLASIPTQTTLHDPAERGWRPGQDKGTVENHDPAGDDLANTGLELRPYFVDWLDAAIAQQSAKDRLEQLREIYPEAYAAHRLRKKRMTHAEIAEELGVSETTVRRLLMKAERYIGRGTNSGDPYSSEERAVLYADLFPERFEVYVYRAYGWSVAHVHDVTGTPGRTIKRWDAHARAYIGEYLPHRRLRRFARAAT